MPTVHMIHGYLGAGKTTFAKRLEANLPAIRFTHDHCMTKLYGIDPPVEEMNMMRERVSEVIEESWTKCVSFGVETVLDLNFWSLSERISTRQKAEELGAEVVLYNLPLPDDEAWARVEKRNANLSGSFFISENTFEALKAGFEPLTPDELSIAIEPSRSRIAIPDVRA